MNAFDSSILVAALVDSSGTMPLEKRMNFLRKRLPGGGSCL